MYYHPEGCPNFLTQVLTALGPGQDNDLIYLVMFRLCVYPPLV